MTSLHNNPLATLFEEHYKQKPTQSELIAGSGSNRQYYRLQSETHSAIGVLGTSLEENRAFIGLTQHFELKGLPVPHILKISHDKMAYLQSDLGKLSLYAALEGGRQKGNYDAKERALLRQTICLLPKMQVLGVQGLDLSLCYPVKEMDRRSIHFDLNYFKYNFLKLQQTIDFDEYKLENDFWELSADILTQTNNSKPSLILRDCQARNVMLKEESGIYSPYFIDYQSSRLGPKEYDLASFLYQASAHYPEACREEMIESYILSLKEIDPQGASQVRDNLRLMALFRLLQVLGAYGFRGLIEKKSYFLNSIPPAIENLDGLLKEGVVNKYSYLKQILGQIVTLVQVQEAAKLDASSPSTPSELIAAAPPLTVTIHSFSYKKGIPQDPSGNGGGYVFDCRSTHNPGRYEPYKKQTGLDASVIKFLEDDGEILQFLSHVYPLVHHHTERFVSRHFNSLMLSFGCTGGQHRSVYCAQHTAEYLRKNFPEIRIHLIHREQGIDQYV